MTISKELLDELLSGVERPEDLLGDKGLMKELKVRLMERMLGAELTEHLGYEPHGAPASQQSNRRNGATRKVLKGNDGAVPIDIPRDSDGKGVFISELADARAASARTAPVGAGQGACRLFCGDTKTDRTATSDGLTLRFSQPTRHPVASLGARKSQRHS